MPHVKRFKVFTVIMWNVEVEVVVKVVVVHCIRTIHIFMDHRRRNEVLVVLNHIKRCLLQPNRQAIMYRRQSTLNWTDRLAKTKNGNASLPMTTSMICLFTNFFFPALFVSLDNQKWDRLCAMTLNALKQKHSKSFSLWGK